MVAFFMWFHSLKKKLNTTSITTTTKKKKKTPQHLKRIILYESNNNSIKRRVGNILRYDAGCPLLASFYTLLPSTHFIQ